MILDPINAQDFVRARPRLRKSPAACHWPQLLRLFLLVSVGLGLISLSLNPSRVMAAGAAVEQTPGHA